MDGANKEVTCPLCGQPMQLLAETETELFSGNTPVLMEKWHCPGNRRCRGAGTAYFTRPMRKE
jgi:hypothetical protein